MNLILASQNAHKLAEVRAILGGHRVTTPADEGVDFHFEETGTTYVENALGKALHLFGLVGRPVIADDSGLSVPSLGGAPGVRSARYGSEKAGRRLSDQERNEILLANMAEISDRRAFFVCCMVIVLSEYRYVIAQETLEGEITHRAVGTGGFGYDPVFFLADYGCTVAELGAPEKNRLSHRGKAAALVARMLGET